MTERDRQQPLKLKRAIDHMHRGSCLIRMHSSSGAGWFVVPGGPVSDATAAKIREHPAVIGGKDGLFPKCDQTWRMLDFVS
jgi:hypothetical protein